jgi:hypothetical protein
MHTNYNIPQWLDNYIFGNLGAVINRNHAKVTRNVNNSHQDNLEYLGTYFPRTYAEISTVMGKLYNETNYFQLEEIKNKRSLNILSVGCGTGGEVIGLIDSLTGIMKITDISITLADGNIDALNIASNIIGARNFEEMQPTKIQVINETITSSSGFHRIAGMLSSPRDFDFIITSKLINELLDQFDYPYSEFIKTFCDHLTPTGLMIITDTTDRRPNNGSDMFIPQIMNQNINNNIPGNLDIGTIMPPTCNNDSCNRACFTCFKNEYSYGKTIQDSLFGYWQKREYKTASHIFGDTVLILIP